MVERLLARGAIALAAGLLVFAQAADPASAHRSHMSSIAGRLEVREPPTGHVPATLELTIEVSYKGLDHHAGLELDAALGQEVVITFVWADESVPDNVHRLLLTGYDLKTGLLDRENRTQTLRFVADRTGTFELVCDWRCEGHKEALQSAKLTVTDVHSNDPLAPAPTALLLVPLASGNASEVGLAATLTAADGKPLAGAPVEFLLRTRFAGVHGEAVIAAVLTDANGAATATYRPTSSGGHEFIVRFAGSDLLAPTEEMLRLTVDDPVPAYVVAPRGLNAISDLVPLVVLLLVLSIWTTFAYVLFQVVRIRHANGEPWRPAAPTSRRSTPRKEGSE